VLKDYRKNVTEAGVEIRHKSYPEKVRFIPNGERCSCETRKGYYTQCKHEICKYDGVFCLDLIEPRNHFFSQVLRVKRNSNLAGEVFPQNEVIPRASGDQLIIEETGGYACQLMEMNADVESSVIDSFESVFTEPTPLVSENGGSTALSVFGSQQRQLKKKKLRTVRL
jgi:hypothetical protein